jgi:K+-transporting ATPase ATPase A chain
MTLLVAATARPFGLYIAAVLGGRRTLLDPVLVPVERGFYALSGVDGKKEQGWLAYAYAVLAFSAAGFFALYAILRLQAYLPFNPQGLPGLSPHLAFNTAISFVTNTNWQSYGGETTMSYFAQMAGLAVQNFLSAATGLAIAVALTRAFMRSGAKTVGNFWVDLTRSALYLLLPLAIVTTLVLVALGVPQNLNPYETATTLEGGQQIIAQGPVASQVAIKHLGTNGGGFFNANSAHPLENPSALSNIVEMWAMIVLPLALAIAFGRLVGREREGWVLFGVMVTFVTVGAGLIYWAESSGTTTLNLLSIAGGNMEGKEVRFGLDATAVFSAWTTGVSCGAVNAMLGSFTPLGGLVPLFLILLGEVLPGGVGSGLYGILVMAILAVFIAGLMVGRTPEYLGKKIEAREIKMVMLAILVMPLFILGFAAVAAVIPQGLAGLGNAGPHGFSEILYAYSSATGNNGSAFGGLTANSPWYNTTLGLCMLFGRFAFIVPVLAIAGSLAAKPKLAPSAGTFPTDGLLFAGLLGGVILIVTGLEFFPALALGPIVEQFQMLGGRLF